MNLYLGMMAVPACHIDGVFWASLCVLIPCSVTWCVPVFISASFHEHGERCCCRIILDFKQSQSTVTKRRWRMRFNAEKISHRDWNKLMFVSHNVPTSMELGLYLKSNKKSNFSRPNTLKVIKLGFVFEGF